MAETIAIERGPAYAFPRKFFPLIPGVLLLVALGYAGKITEQSIARYGKAHHMVLPNIEYVLWAILFGLLVSNTVGVPRIFLPGLQLTDSGSSPALSYSACASFWATC